MVEQGVQFVPRNRHAKRVKALKSGELAEGVCSIEATQEEQLHFGWGKRAQARDRFDGTLAYVAVAIVQGMRKDGQCLRITRGTERLYGKLATIGIEPGKRHGQGSRCCTSATAENIHGCIAKPHVLAGLEQGNHGFHEFGCRDKRASCTRSFFAYTPIGIPQRAKKQRKRVVQEQLGNQRRRLSTFLRISGIERGGEEIRGDDGARSSHGNLSPFVRR